MALDERKGEKMPSIKITKRSDGRYCTTITEEETKKRIFFYGKTPAEVKRKLFQHQQKEVKGSLFTEISNLWWEEAQENLSTQSIRGYKAAKQRADVEFSYIYIREIKTKNVTDYFQKLSLYYRSQKTLEKYRLVLNLIFKYAIQMGEITSNPCEFAKMPKGLQKSKRNAASVEDEKIIRETEDCWLFPFFALNTGMRKGEILALQWKDIDFEENVINVNKSVGHNGNMPIINPPKTEAGVRYVPLLNPLKERLLNVKHRKAENYIFSDDGKKPLTNRRYITLYDNYKKQTGVTCTAHQLRHSFATVAHEVGLDGKDIQEILGHKQLSTTMDIYTDFRKKRLKDVAEILNKQK